MDQQKPQIITGPCAGLKLLDRYASESLLCVMLTNISSYLISAETYCMYRMLDNVMGLYTAVHIS